MPIYEYECTKCGHQTEIWQKFSEVPLTKCEMCRGKMKKLISPSSFHLKGTGWYVTDYASTRGGGGEGKGKSDNDSATKKAKSSKETSKKETSSSGDKNAKD